MTIFILILFSYLLGSIAWAVVFSKLLNKPDPRSAGSNNPGATNALRTGGKLLGILTLAADMVKGLLPVLIAQQFELPLLWVSLVGLAAFLGHLYPVFFHFKGGKGVATSVGILFGLSVSGTFGLLLVWAGVLGLTRYVSLASMVALALAPFAIGWGEASFWPLTILSVLMIWRHRDNIQRLRSGAESKITASQQQ